MSNSILAVRSTKHAVRKVNTWYKELNYGTAVYRLLYEKFGLHDFFARKQKELRLSFDLDAVMFALMYFNIEPKLTEPLDLAHLDTRRCLFDFTLADAGTIQQALDSFTFYEEEFEEFIHQQAKKVMPEAEHYLKHSPNPKVVLKSVAYMLRCVFIDIVHEAGYTIAKGPLFLLLNEGTILRPGDRPEDGLQKFNKAFGTFGTAGNTLTVRKLLAIFDIDAAAPMRNAAELKAALHVTFPLCEEIRNIPRRLSGSRTDTPADIDEKPGSVPP